MVLILSVLPVECIELYLCFERFKISQTFCKNKRKAPLKSYPGSYSWWLKEVALHFVGLIGLLFGIYIINMQIYAILIKLPSIITAFQHIRYLSMSKISNGISEYFRISRGHSVKINIKL